MALTNLERYDREFIRTFKVKKEELADMKYEISKVWDSVSHMDLMAGLEDVFDVNLDTIDILRFTDYHKGKEILEKYGVVF